MSWLAVILLTQVATFPFSHKFRPGVNQVDQVPPLGFDTPWWPLATPGPIRVPNWTKPDPSGTPDVPTTLPTPFSGPPTQPPIIPSLASPTSWISDRRNVAWVAITVVVVLTALTGCIYACRWELYMRCVDLKSTCVARPTRDSRPRHPMEEPTHPNVLHQAQSSALQDACPDLAPSRVMSNEREFLEACERAERRTLDKRPELMHHSTPSATRSFVVHLQSPLTHWSNPPSYSTTAL